MEADSEKSESGIRPTENRRLSPRLALDLSPRSALFRTPGGTKDYYSWVINSSRDGALLQVVGQPEVTFVGTHTLLLPSGEIACHVERAARGGQIVVKFESPLSAEHFESAFFQCPPAEEVLAVEVEQTDGMSLEALSETLNDLGRFLDIGREIFAEAYEQATGRTLVAPEAEVLRCHYGSPLAVDINLMVGIAHIVLALKELSSSRALTDAATQLITGGHVHYVTAMLQQALGSLPFNVGTVSKPGPKIAGHLAQAQAVLDKLEKWTLTIRLGSFRASFQRIRSEKRRRDA